MFRATKSTCTSHVNSAELWAGNVFGPNLVILQQLSTLGMAGDDLQDGKVRKVVHERTHIRLGASMLFPLLIERLPVFAQHLHRSEELLDLKASPQNDDIEFVLTTVFTDNASLVNLFDAFWYELEIRFVQSIEVVRIEDSALAAYSISLEVLMAGHLLLTYPRENQELDSRGTS